MARKIPNNSIIGGIGPTPYGAGKDFKKCLKKK